MTCSMCYKYHCLKFVAILNFSGIIFIYLTNRDTCKSIKCFCFYWLLSAQFSSSVVRLSATPWTAAHQASLFITNPRSLPKLMSSASVMPSNHLILCCPRLLQPSIFPSIRVFSNESALCISWQKYWGFSFNISPSKDYSGLISSGMDW